MPRTDVADMFTVLCPGGRFQPYVDGVITRKDGVHLSDAGADLVTRFLQHTTDLGGRT